MLGGAVLNTHLILNKTITRKFNRAFHWGLLLSAFSVSHIAMAGPNVFEVGAGSIHDTFVNNTYDTFDFQTPFASTPAVFAIGNVAGSNSCEVRFQNISTTEFEAVCAEDSSWDGQHVAVPLQYMAIAEGVQTIPTNNGGSVTFEAGCIETNAVQHNCTTGCDTESYEPITFSAGFSGAPVVITNIQTSNNAQLGAAPVNPIQPMLSVAVDNIAAGGFDLALDLNKENNVGTLNDERVCWLAIEETSNCNLMGTDNTLDFSGVGGPSSVAFEALITDEDVDGWDNGCNAGEGASFTPGCFTSTPVAIATKRSRNEEEGWLRYCALNSGEFRFTIDEQRVSGQNRQHVDESASVIAFGSSFTTPVSLSLFQAQQRGQKSIEFQWQTESESFNVGFNLWGLVAGEWQQINTGLIAAKFGDFSESQHYQKKVVVAKELLKNIDAVGLSSIDNSGYEEFYGPFNIGERYGEQASFEAIAWSNIRSEYEQRMVNNGFTKLRNGRWVKATKKHLKRQQNRQYQFGKQRAVVELVASEVGVHKVPAVSLLEQAPELLNAPINTIALTHRGQAVPRIIESQDELLSADDSLVFRVTELESNVALYTNDKVYRVYRDRQKTVNAGVLSNLPDDEVLHQTGLQPQWQGENSEYFVASTSGDPWYDTMLLSTGSPASKQYVFNHTISASSTNVLSIDSQINNALVSINVSGGIDLPGSVDDHHLQVSLNGNHIADERFDGFSYVEREYSVPAEWLVDGANTVEVSVVGDTGKFADIVYIDSVGLSAPKPLVNEPGLAFTFTGSDEQAPFYKVDTSVDQVAVYAHQDNGNFTQLKTVALDNNALGFGGIDGGIDELHSNNTTHYTIVDPSAYLTLDHIQRVEPKNLVRKLDANYLIVAHPAFLGEELSQFADTKIANGHTVSIVSWLDIVNSYGYGVHEPTALRNYLKAASANNKIDYVLLVGGHSYDYNDYLSNGNVTFLPTQYEAVSRHFQYAPTDNHFADLNDDGLPDVALGRWPVRTTDDLKTIIAKTKAWEENQHKYSHRLMLVADATDQARGQRFATQIDTMTEQVGIDRSSVNVNEVYLDHYLERGQAVQEAKAELLSHYQPDSAGIGLTVFSGHASSSRWTYRNLLNAADVGQMHNSGKPTTVMPLACYTTYYETPSVNSMAHQLLFESDGGAVLIAGAAYLSEDRENSIFGVNMLKAMKGGKNTWGQAMKKVKSRMSPWNDAVTNWTILGDPSLSLQ